MSRILLATLAVLSLLLAIVFSKTFLYGLAILFVGLAVVSYLYDKKRDFFPGGRTSSLSGSTSKSQEELKSLGILEIKPKGSSSGQSTSGKESTRPNSTGQTSSSQSAAERNASAQNSARERSGNATASTSVDDTAETVKVKPESDPTSPGAKPLSKPEKQSPQKARAAKAGTKSSGETAELFGDAMDEEHIPFSPGEEVSAPRPVSSKPKKQHSDRTDSGKHSGRPNPSKATPRRDQNYIAVQEALDEKLGLVLLPCLASLRAAVNAHTVCVLSYKLDTTKYSIVGVVSKNGYARTSGSFISPVPLIKSTKNRNTVEVMRVGKEGLLEDAVGYYRENIAVRNVATARIYASSEAERYLLLADSFDESFVADATSCRLFDRYAQVIGPMLDMHFGPEDIESDGARPRREIIADEISNARAAQKDLALALIYLNDAEDVSQKSKDEISKIEDQLDKLLRRSTDKGRVEHFGELTYGVLYRGNVNDVERWAIRVQNEASKKGNGLSGGVSVGVAMLTDRHRGADELRTDASTALEEALETGACTILE